MARKIRKYIICFFALLVLCNTTLNAKSYSIYDGSINTTVITYFKDIVSKVSINENYVFFRGGQYDYYLIVSDSLTFNNNSFTSSTAHVYNINTNSNYNSNYYFSYSEIDSFDLVVGNQLIYSNLAHYPSLFERGYIYDYATLFLFFVFCLCFLIRSIFTYTKHKR